MDGIKIICVKGKVRNVIFLDFRKRSLYLCLVGSDVVLRESICCI